MGVATLSQDISVAVAPARIFKAMFLDNHNLYPKIASQHIKSVEIIEGDGGVGTVKKTTFTEGSRFNSWTTKIEALDVEACSIKLAIIDGDVLADKLEKIVFEVKIEASGAGSVCKITGHFHTRVDVAPTDEQIEGAKNRMAGLYKKVEEYLVANPSVYA